MAEETGIQIAIETVDPDLFDVDCHDANGHRHLDLRFLFQVAYTEPVPGPDESQDVMWFNFDEALSIVDPALANAISLAATDSLNTVRSVKFD
jgi:8-oxo-dGTP pyrophosphatase MutT (NUDIX family)